MTEYAGSAVTGCFNGLRIPNVTMFNPDETADLGKLETTHGGDATKQFINDIPQAGEFTATLRAWIDAGSDNVAASPSLAPGTSGSLDLYPEGAPAAGGKPWIYCHDCMITRRNMSYGVGSVSVVDFGFKNNNSATLTTNGVSASYSA